jgi:nitroreductase
LSEQLDAGMVNTELSRLLNTHRSIRSYKADPVDPALVDGVIEDAVAGASSSGNLNSISIILTRDPDRKQRLYDLHFGQPMVLQAPLVITFCADWFRTRQWLRLRGARDNFNNLLGYHVAAYDAMIVAQNVCLGFEAHGLGICYMGTTLSSLAELSVFFNLPETCVPVTTIVVGYPDEDPGKRDRLPASGLVHDEIYRHPDAEEIEETFSQREIRGWERYMSIPSIKAAIEANGITSLARYYTSKIKYDPDVFTRDSAVIKQLLQEKGFLQTDGLESTMG